MPEGCDVDDVRVLRIDDDPGHGLRVLKAHMGPGFARVGGLVDTVALRDIASNLPLAHPDVNDVGVRVAYSDRANGGSVEEPVRYAPPALSRVRGFPKAPTRGSEVVFGRTRADAGASDGSATAIRADVLPL